MNAISQLIAATIITILLTACGGGGSSTSSTSALSGVAAVGTPIINGNINVICAAGSALATTTNPTTGAWQVTLSGQTLPCAVEVSGGTINGVSNTTPYHSIATTTGTVNVTPLTDLLVANLVGSATPSTWFAGLSTSPAPLASITTTQVNTALTNLSTALSGLPQLGSINPITTAFTPTSGNSSDDMLTALATAMTSNSTPYASLLSNASTPTITAPTGFNTALSTAYSSTASVSISATANTTAQSLTVGTAMTSFSPLTATGGTAPYTYSYAGTLPAGLSFNTGSGAVTGTPTAPYATSNLVFSVQDAHNVVANTSSTVSFTVGAASSSISATATTTAQNLTVGTAMPSFSPLTPSGGATPYTYSYTGTLPAGLSFNSSTGAVTGTPTATYTAANLVFSVKDANNVMASTTSTVSFTVVAAPVNITATATTTAQNLTVGTAIASFSPLTASGGATPYTYSYTGTLPTGLSFNSSTGAVTGTPTAIYAATNLVFSAKDANNVMASTTSTVSFTVVAASVSISATATTTAQNLMVGTAMTSFTPLTASGGTTPYAYSYTGTLPTGLSFNSSTGAVTGAPTTTYAAANLVFSVKDANNVVASATSTVSFTVVPAGVTLSGYIAGFNSLPNTSPISSNYNLPYVAGGETVLAGKNYMWGAPSTIVPGFLGNNATLLIWPNSGLYAPKYDDQFIMTFNMTGQISCGLTSPNIYTLCASEHVTFDSATGTITFASTPIVGTITTITNITATGALSFTPY